MPCSAFSRDVKIIIHARYRCAGTRIRKRGAEELENPERMYMMSFLFWLLDAGSPECQASDAALVGRSGSLILAGPAANCPEWRKMRRKGREQGSAAIAFAFAIFLVIFTVVTVYLFLAKPAWGWFPPAITEFGKQIDAQFHRTLIITGVVFVLGQLGLALAIFRSRDQGQKVSFFEGNSAMEFIWTMATVIMFVGLGLYGEHAWAEAHFQGEAPGALEVEITGQQFTWNVRYAGPDGKWGKQDRNW